MIPCGMASRFLQKQFPDFVFNALKIFFVVTQQLIDVDGDHLRVIKKRFLPGKEETPVLVLCGYPGSTKEIEKVSYRRKMPVCY